MSNPPTSDDIKELTRAVNHIADALNVMNQNSVQTAKIWAEMTAELMRIKNELHETNRPKVRVYDSLSKEEVKHLTTGD